MMLKKPVNFREIKPKNSCANCKYNVFDGDYMSGHRVCERSGNFEWGDPENMYHYVCDGYKHSNLLGLELS